MKEKGQQTNNDRQNTTQRLSKINTAIHSGDPEG
jgi:hypothetical protein